MTALEWAQTLAHAAGALMAQPSRDLAGAHLSCAPPMRWGGAAIDYVISALCPPVHATVGSYLKLTISCRHGTLFRSI